MYMEHLRAGEREVRRRVCQPIMIYSGCAVKSCMTVIVRWRAIEEEMMDFIKDSFEVGFPGLRTSFYLNTPGYPNYPPQDKNLRERKGIIYVNFYWCRCCDCYTDERQF